MNLPIKHGSIKARLILMIAICVAGMLILAANQIHNTNRFIELNSQSKTLLNLNILLLQLRRHEKDFLLRLDDAYLELFEHKANIFEQQLASLHKFFADKKNEQSLFSHVQKSMSNYRHRFAELAVIHKQIGLNENLGYQGQFRQATHKLEQQLLDVNQPSLQLALLQLRRHEKDFMLRQQVAYVDKHFQQYSQLRQALVDRNNGQMVELLDSYQLGFKQLFDAQQKMGLTHSEGLQGEFRQQAHQAEDALNTLDKYLVSLLNETEQKVERNSMLIMLATSLVLIILLIRSFITLQKAFSTFVMFFYRCKREYQHIDERKQGFSEFKYLASIANEMIDARQEMEQELKQAHKQIEKMQQAKDSPQEGSS